MIRIKTNANLTIPGINGESAIFTKDQWLEIKPRWVMPAFLNEFLAAFKSVGFHIEDQNGDQYDYQLLDDDAKHEVWYGAIYHLQNMR